MIALLIRHAHADPVGGWLAGRRPGVTLSDLGRDETLSLVRALTWAPLTAVYSSPLERAVETASPIAADHGLRVHVRPDLTDIDFGAWTGKTLDELSATPAWIQFNRNREHAYPPGGESLSDVQRRIVRELQTLASTHLDETIVVVTHAEPIRCAIAAFSGDSLDAAMGFEIHPGHVSTVGVADVVRRVLSVNVPPHEITV